MIFVDANVILRVLTRPGIETNRWLHERAAEFFRQARRGELKFTTSDAILAEVAFILTSRKHYQIPATDAAALLGTIVRLRGFRHPNKRVILRSLELWSEHPGIGFVDALTAAYGQSPGMVLMTFDADFDTLPGIDRWGPA